MWKVQYALSVLSFLLAVALISRLIRERRSPGSTVAWLLVMSLVPHLGVPLFLTFGGRKLKRVKKQKQELYEPIPSTSIPSSTLPMERMLLASGIPPKSEGNEVALLCSGEEAYHALLQTLRMARHQIHIATFILSLDPVGKSIVAILEEKAKEGIQVRLLLDGLGSFWTFRWRLKDLRQAGAKVAYFLPLIHVPFFGHSNLRNHRKLVLVDGETAILGGMNLAQEYLGGTPDSNRWVDLSLKLSGSAVSSLEDHFVADWQFASGETLLSHFPKRTSSCMGHETLQVVASGPDVPGDPLYDSIVSAIFAAKEHVWIASPYFIPDETLSKSLELAAKRGVDVRLLIPKKSNHLLADLCRGGYLRQLEQAGGQIFYFPGIMMHAKAVIVDDFCAVVGSANFDMRSLLLNYEIGLFLYSTPAIREVRDWYASLLERSIQEPLSKPGFPSDLAAGIGRILGPFL